MQGSMKLEQLEYFGIPPYLINIWKEHYSDFLLPVQEKAIRQFHLLSHSNKNFIPYYGSLQNQKNLKNLLVLSPSSSGKTLLAEIAALQEITLKNKVIYLVPLRVLAEEKYQHFKQLYHPIGLNVKLSSRDHRWDDEDIIQGNFHIAVIVYEKFYYLLLQHPKFMDNVTLIIADEIQLINDFERGPRLENSFNYLKNNYPAIRMIALSAFTEYLRPLAHWLEAELLTSSYRPVELRKGIVRKGVYQYIEHNSKTAGEELFFPPEAAEECNLASYLKSTLQFLLSKQETSLIFFSTKKEVRLWGRWLAGELSLGPARNAIKQLHALEDSTSKEELLNLLQNGVGYHCADLSFPERHSVEEAVRTGELKIICATGTLAMGVNLPVNNVILTGQKVTSERSITINNNHSNKDNIPGYSRRILTSSEVENMGGRAGRLNSVHSFGRIIFLAPSLIELTAYQKLYFSSCPVLSHTVMSGNVLCDNLSFIPDERDAVYHNISDSPAATFVPAVSFVPAAYDTPCYTNSEFSQNHPIAIQQDLLTFILYRIAFDCQSLEDIKEIMKSGKNKETPAFWLHQFSKKYEETDIIACLKHLENSALLKPSPHFPEKNYEISEMGQLVTSKGITFQTYTHFLKWIKESAGENSSELEILLLVATSCDGRSFFTDYPKSSQRTAKIKNKISALSKWQEYLRLRLLSQVFERGEEGKLIFRHYLNIDSQQTQSHISLPPPKEKMHIYLAFKNTLLMYDWISGRELREMEEDYGILGGAIQKIGEGFSWLTDTLAALAAQLGWKEERVPDLERIQQLSARLITGLKPEGLSLAKLQIPGLTRGYIVRLLQEGYDHKDCLKELSEQQLEQLLPALLVKKIKDTINSNDNSRSSLSSNFKQDIINSLDRSVVSPDYSKLEQNRRSAELIPKPKEEAYPYPKSAKNKLAQLNTSNKSNELGWKPETVLIIDHHRPDRILFLQEEIEVNKTGFQLLLLLAQNKGKVLSYEQIIDHLWHDDMDATYHRLWYHLAKLRNGMKKIIQRKKGQNEQNEMNNSGEQDRPKNQVLTSAYLKEKIFKVIPGRGILFDEEVLLEIKE